MDRGNHGTGVIRMDAGMDTVAEIEHMAVTFAVAFEHATDLFADSRG